MLMDADFCQLVLVDYQEKLMPAIYEHEKVLENAITLGKLAKLFQVPVWGTEQNPGKLGGNAPEVRALCDRTISKMMFGAAYDGLLDVLRPQSKAAAGNARSLPRHLQKKRQEQEDARDQIVIAGCEAHVCLMQTALDLLAEDLTVWVVTDACSSRTERNRDAAFDRLAGAGAELVTTEMVAFEWCRSADHPDFRAMLELIK